MGEMIGFPCFFQVRWWAPLGSASCLQQLQGFRWAPRGPLFFPSKVWAPLGSAACFSTITGFWVGSAWAPCVFPSKVWAPLGSASRWGRLKVSEVSSSSIRSGLRVSVRVCLILVLLLLLLGQLLRWRSHRLVSIAPSCSLAVLGIANWA